MLNRHLCNHVKSSKKYVVLRSVRGFAFQLASEQKQKIKRKVPMKISYKLTLSPVLVFRLVRWAFGAFIIIVGLIYKDAWATYLFGGLIIITSFFKPIGCAGTNCQLETKR